MVDDEPAIHAVLRLALQNIVIDGRGLQLLEARSGDEAKARLDEHPDIALVLLDVVMETEHAGLDLVRHIREELSNRWMQIVLVTGQPGYAPQREVITNFQIDGYRLKSELTADKIFVSVYAALRTHQAMLDLEQQRQQLAQVGAELEQHRRHLEMLVEQRTTDLAAATKVAEAARIDAERANNSKSRFLAAASHDLRQPLSALNLYIDVLRAKSSAADRPLLVNLKECVASLNVLLTDLLDLSKLDAGVVTPSIVDFPIADILSNLQSVHAPDAQLKGLRLRCVESGLTVRTDAVMFRRMVCNLVSNAIRYTERGTVLIGCRRRHGKTWVEVWDTGIGIPKAKTKEIFEEFKQLDEARTRGSGLGLAIVDRSAKLLGLDVRVRSTPGRGSMFAIEAPIGVEASLRPLPPAGHRSLRIALVEDNEHVRQALDLALRAAGHEVVSAADCRSLLARFDCWTPDVLISDYRLSGGETGFDVITRVRAEFGENLPAVLITGDTDPNLIRSMAGRGVVVQHKPLQIDALQACIQGMAV
ncbi:MAG TPA: ATP-binding protein [Aromatoleum sp.]|uniref:ATP-binding response regulator n=1 Tax=Aromatoleum sp. TaxID=2307007 RepID=UPI002B489D32|nr:ATP-binding protein [Aromatoleum sp.]HJV25835.1 ATP-binding protein [Aromatoleum sp.]